MFTLLRSCQRRHEQRGLREVWQTFVAPDDDPCPLAGGFGSLVAFDELWLPPGESTEPHADGGTERITYVYAGALAHEDSAGSSGLVHVGEFQHMSTGERVRHKETNGSRSTWAHVFRIALRPWQVGLDRAHEQKRFTAAERRNVLCVVASPDGRKGSLRIQQDALVFSSILDCGHHLAHQLLAGHGAWLHIIRGEAALSDIVLAQGDSVGVADEPAVSLTASEDSEVLLIDVASTRTTISARGEGEGR